MSEARGLRRSLSGVVMSVKGRCHVIKTEFGKEYTTNIKNSSLSTGDDVHISFDYTADEILTLQGKEVAFTDDNAVHVPESKAPPFINDED